MTMPVRLLLGGPRDGEIVPFPLFGMRELGGVYAPVNAVVDGRDVALFLTDCSAEYQIWHDWAFVKFENDFQV